MIPMVDEKTILFTRSMYSGGAMGFSPLNESGDCVIHYHHCREVLCGSIARSWGAATGRTDYDCSRYNKVLRNEYSIHMPLDSPNSLNDKFSRVLKVLHSFEDKFGLERTEMREIHKDSLFLAANEDTDMNDAPTDSRVGEEYPKRANYNLFKVKIGERWAFAMPMLSLHLLILRAGYRNTCSTYNKLLKTGTGSDVASLRAFNKKIPILLKNLDAIYSGISVDDRWIQPCPRLGVNGIEKLLDLKISSAFTKRLKAFLDEKNTA